MLVGLSLLACLAYLVPLIALAALFHDDKDDGIDVAAKLASWFAADLLATFALVLFFKVETAAFIRLGLGITAACAIAVVRARRGGRVLARRSSYARAGVGIAAVAAAVAFVLNHGFSSAYWIWDREWHVPFTASLRAQQLPIENVYEPGLHFRYHLIGDLAGAVIQVYSAASMSAARALAYVHDLQALLLAYLVASLLRTASRWSRPAIVLLAQVPILAGPIGLRHHPAGGLGYYEGYADFSNLTLSFRPHCSVALVLIVGFFCHVVRWARVVTEGGTPTTKVLAASLPLMGLLGITDEISGFIVGLALGVAWLTTPQLLGARRWHGPLLLAAYAVLALLANQFLAGTLARGGPVSHAELLAPRLPRFFADGLPLSAGGEAWKELSVDIGALLLPLGVVVPLVLRGWRRPDLLVLPTLLVGVTFGVSLAMFLCLEVNGRTYEGHRFLTAVRVLTPLLCLLVLPRLASNSLRRLAVAAPVAAGVFATLGFFIARMPDNGGDLKQTKSQYGANCREDYGAHLGERMLPTWVDQSIWYEYAGCRPIFAAPSAAPGDVVLVGWPDVGRSAYAKMDDHFFGPNRSARMVCSREASQQSELCREVQKVVSCRREGARALMCVIPASLRAKVRRL